MMYCYTFVSAGPVCSDVETTGSRGSNEPVVAKFPARECQFKHHPRGTAARGERSLERGPNASFVQTGGP